MPLRRDPKRLRPTREVLPSRQRHPQLMKAERALSATHAPATRAFAPMGARAPSIRSTQALSAFRTTIRASYQAARIVPAAAGSTVVGTKDTNHETKSL